MRISDWSSDVCSSVLAAVGAAISQCAFRLCRWHQRLAALWSVRRYSGHRGRRERTAGADRAARPRWSSGDSGRTVRPSVAEARSEEHTSELQSLMRNSYAVFCLKKKKKNNNKNSTQKITRKLKHTNNNNNAHIKITKQ